ncbi:hypothetical protein EVAR_98627_1 [Eumeta japonica]|uniref:DUF5641 domain-containing protein n=1 Tax=Eumeta variegata TaxID=151549 RepID=A0A4C1XWU8_EUMVA|nr:hypothetical protein EVAR_98627_1 [Eumeta japonica]
MANVAPGPAAAGGPPRSQMSLPMGSEEEAADSFKLVKRKSRKVAPKMADLPEGRFAFRQRPFTHTGVDYFGPKEVTVGRRRVHVSDDTRRPHGGRGLAIRRLNDNGATKIHSKARATPHVIQRPRTNFVGAAAELTQAHLEIQERMSDEATTRAIRWLCIPPHASHMGGSPRERLVRSIKVASSATLHTRAPRDKVLHTMMLEAEFVVNSRPLTHISVLPSDPTALTPNHFLLGSAAGRWQSGHFNTNEESSRKQWRASQALAEMFWQRWLREYLPTLQRRHKWIEGRPPIKVGDAVIITDPALPCNTWPRGITEKVYPRIDGQVRVVDIRTAHGRLRRPTARLAVLPTEAESSHALRPGVEC